jgi:hypothetical protein
MTSPARVLFVFVDGVGIGPARPATNPFATGLPVLRSLLGGRMVFRGDARRSGRGVTCVPLNATLGVPGLPQSGTGQTTLLTGVNAPKFIGKHFGPYPYSTLRPILEERNIFVRLQGRGRRVQYVNAFPQRYFDYIAARPTRRSAIASAWLATGHPLHTADRLAAGVALSADITSERWNKGGFPPVTELTPSEAGRRLAGISREHDFTLFEYYETDHAGHSCSMEEARMVLAKLDEFLGGVLDAMDHAATLLVLTSDHGNLEDLSTKSHTRNPVPLLAVGQGHAALARGVRSLAQVAPAIARLLVP